MCILKGVNEMMYNKNVLYLFYFSVVFNPCVFLFFQWFFNFFSTIAITAHFLFYILENKGGILKSQVWWFDASAVHLELRNDTMTRKLQKLK